ncbi:MAG: hypothetical protein Q3Y08_03930, partial [Butyricicoccus sp.]|nr:hypothetical protein [Butyricicoccus sp.]
MKPEVSLDFGKSNRSTSRLLAGGMFCRYFVKTRNWKEKIEKFPRKNRKYGIMIGRSENGLSEWMVNEKEANFV